MKSAQTNSPWRWLLLGVLALAAVAHFHHHHDRHLRDDNPDVW
jgi:hypothetical protein